MTELPEAPMLADLINAIERLRVSIDRIAPAPGPVEEIPQHGPELFSIRETCELLSVSRSTLHRLRERGELRPVMVAGAPRYARADLDAYFTRLRRRT